MRTLWQTTRGRYTISLEWKLEDLWVGVFWKETPVTVYKPHRDSVFEHFNYEAVSVSRLDVWLCLLPCLPIHICREV